MLCRGGSRKDNQRKNDHWENAKFTRLIGCPFLACETYLKVTGQWYFKCEVSYHKHPALTDPRAHVENCHLTPAQYTKVKNLTEAGLKPAKILRVMQTTMDDGKTLLATKNTIYVAKRWVKTESLQGLSPIVHLKNQLGKSDYTTHIKTDSDGTLKALFFCHNTSLKLYSAYNTILFLDST